MYLYICRISVWSSGCENSALGEHVAKILQAVHLLMFPQQMVATVNHRLFRLNHVSSIVSTCNYICSTSSYIFNSAGLFLVKYPYNFTQTKKRFEKHRGPRRGVKTHHVDLPFHHNRQGTVSFQHNPIHRQKHDHQNNWKQRHGTVLLGCPVGSWYAMVCNWVITYL